MRYYALACDYDGTLASHGAVNPATLDALERVRRSGRKLLLVTGRQLDDLERVFPHLDWFDRVVVENGAVLFRPASREEVVLGEPPPERLIATLHERGVTPLSVGRTIVATWEPHQVTVLDTIRELGLELQVSFNKGAVMILPAGVTKATGLARALAELELSPLNVAGIGDAENDHAFLSLCACAAAVQNALPAVKERADLVTAAPNGAGVVELIERLVYDDLAEADPRLTRHHVLLGHTSDGREERVPGYGANVLLAGTSGGGKTTFATAFIEQLVQHGYQFCIVDPEGDYRELEGPVVKGDTDHAPTLEDAVRLLADPAQNAILDLTGVRHEDRPGYFERLFAALLQLRARTGRPHWILLDEVHHLLPEVLEPRFEQLLPQALHGTFMITVHPEHVARAALAQIDLVLAVGSAPGDTLERFSKVVGEPAPTLPERPIERGEAIAWWRRRGEAPRVVRGRTPRVTRRRHIRKYAEGELPEDRSFYFRGPENRLNLRAQNLTLFLQLGDGVDDQTWEHHLRRGDYSRWVREAIKDDELADALEEVERNLSLSPQESRRELREQVQARYTQPA